MWAKIAGHSSPMAESAHSTVVQMIRRMPEYGVTSQLGATEDDDAT